MSAPPTLAEKLANVQHMPSLIAATIASDKPTDLYLIRDVIKMSYESVQTRVFLQKYFTNLLLSSRNVYVKIKVLKIVVSLLEEGHPDFHRNLQKTPEAFKESCRLRATEPTMAADCGRIRDIANKVLDMLYEDPPEERQCPYGLPAKTASTSSSGSGSSRHSNQSSLLGKGGGGGGALGGRIQGFGTSNTPQSPSVTDQIGNAVGLLFGSATSKPKKNVIYDEKYATMEYIPQSSSIGRIGGVSGGVTHSTNRDRKLPYTPVGLEHHTGRPGGGWEEEEDPVTPPNSHNGQVDTKTTPTSQVDNEQECKLVEDITTPGGVRVAPPKEDLSRFISRCKVLDCLAVVEFLRIKLQSDNSQILSKSLFVLEALARSDIEDVYSYLDLTLDELTHLSQSSPHASVKAKSTKLLHQLSAVDSLSTIGTKQEVSHNNDTGDLLGGVGGAKNETKEQSSEFAGLFSGLTVSSSNTARPPSSKKMTKPVKDTTPTGGTLLEGLTLDNTGSPTCLPPPSLPAQSAGGGGDLVDFDIDKKEEEVFDPLSTEAPQYFNNELLGGLSSLEEPAIATPTSSSSLLLEPTRTTLITTGSSLVEVGVGVAPVQTTPHLSETMTSTMQVPMMLGPVITGTQGGYQPYTSQFMYNNQVYNRPVQMMPKTQTSDLGSDSSGFGFLSKSSGKASAFDFVKDEMKASMTKN